MRPVLALLGLLAVASCSVGERPTLMEDGQGAIDPGAAAATVGDGQTTTTAAGFTPGDLGLGPTALVTPTGVVVPVVARNGDGYVVQSPCGNEVELGFGQAIDRVEVVLDPGHGGVEQGALGPAGQTEAEVNLDLARRAAVALEAEGVSVALTRTADYRIAIPVRAAIADNLGAAAMVSIHHNSPTPTIDPERIAPGTEVYTQVGSADGSRLGGLIYEEVVAAISVFDAEWAARDDAGVLTVINEAGEDAYGIVRRPEATSVLVELAYLSNPTEALVIGTEEYRSAAANALARGIVRYLETADPGSGFVEAPRLFNPSGDTGGTDGCIDPPLS